MGGESCCSSELRGTVTGNRLKGKESWDCFQAALLALIFINIHHFLFELISEN